MNGDDRICFDRKGRKDGARGRVWSDRNEGVTSSFGATRTDWTRPRVTHRNVPTCHLRDRKTFFPTKCNQWDRGRPCSVSHALYTRSTRDFCDRVYSTSSEKMNRWRWIRQKASGPESPENDPQTHWTSEARWCRRCSCYSLHCVIAHTVEIIEKVETVGTLETKEAVGKIGTVVKILRKTKLVW